VTPHRPVRLLSLFCCTLFLLSAAAQAAAQDQPLVTQIDVTGARRVEEATVRFKLKTRVGDPYSPEGMREDIKSLFSLGYFEDIEVRAEIFEGGLRLTFVLHEKPSIQSIRIVGNRKLAAEKIKGKIDLVEGAIIPPGALVKNAEKVRLLYEEEGYYQAQVAGAEERISPQEVTVTFNIVEGEKFDLGEIRILGARHLKEKDIKKKLQTEELYLFFFGGTLKREEMRRDLDRIRAYYLDNGFLDIVVDEPEIQIDARRKKLRVVIQVQEGPQYRIGELTIKGHTLFPEDAVRKLIKSRAGGVFSRETLQGDVVAITDRYADRGYLFADVAPVTDVKREETTVNVALEITEGRQAFINRIEISGNMRTRDKVIRRLAPLVEGDVYSSSSVQQARRNLENVGYFEDIKIETRRTAAEEKVDLTVDLKEKPTGAFSFGAGFSSVDGPIGLASISQSNLLGLGKRASIAGQIGQRANRFNAVYSDPHFLDSDYLAEIRGYDLQTRYNENQGFNTGVRGGSVAAGHAVVEQVYGMLNYTFERVQIKDLETWAPFLIQRQATESGGVSNTSEVTFSLTRDTRDSFGEPNRGSRVRLAATYAGGFLGADNNFTKYGVEASKYWPLWAKVVGHLRTNVFWGRAFDDTPVLPVQERFFLGGPSTIRGFRVLTVSPKDPGGGDGLTGGNKAGYMNAEILFPLLEQIRMRGVVFFDAGNAYDERTDLEDIFKRRIKRSAGVGLRFNSPIGAIRVEWGFNLAPETGERRQVIHFTAGTAF